MQKGIQDLTNRFFREHESRKKHLDAQRPCDRSEELANAGEIFAIYILSEYYGSGAGRALMDAALERIAEYPRVAVWVLRDNGRAIAFYRKCGFVPDGAEEEIILGTPVTEIRMMLDRGDGK